MPNHVSQHDRGACCRPFCCFGLQNICPLPVWVLASHEKVPFLLPTVCAELCSFLQKPIGFCRFSPKRSICSKSSMMHERLFLETQPFRLLRQPLTTEPIHSWTGFESIPRRRQRLCFRSSTMYNHIIEDINHA